jgi:hypothetical protein
MEQRNHRFVPNGSKRRGLASYRGSEMIEFPVVHPTDFAIRGSCQDGSNRLGMKLGQLEMTLDAQHAATLTIAHECRSGLC